MATRIYTDATDFDAQQGHFTIEGVGNQYYLRIGALNSEDRRLIASLIEDGFVGFFQDEVRIAIAGIASTYDATNDRIEIDRELPELQIEDEYVIRFTQARPGEDGEGGIGTPGEDGEHAEIEVEDTSTGIRVRGKSGGEPDFGPWQDVRDGIDGQDGKEGKPGQDGEEGQDGEPGQDGNDGEDGDDGWSPKFATVPDGERRVLQVADWFGGGGTKPDVGQYVGETGFVAVIAEGVDIRGPAGQDGEDGQDGADSTVPGPEGPQGLPGIDGVSGGGDCVEQVLLNDPTGAQNITSVILPTNYTDFKDVYVAVLENNELRSNTIKIAALVDGRAYRVGASTDVVWTASTRTLQDTGGHDNSNFRFVVLTGCESRPLVASGIWENPVNLQGLTVPNGERTDIYTPQLSGFFGTWMRIGDIVRWNLGFSMRGFVQPVNRVFIDVAPPVGQTIEACRGWMNQPRTYFPNGIYDTRRAKGNGADDTIRFEMGVADTNIGYDFGGNSLNIPYYSTGQYRILSEALNE